jgi:hypothetical protein
MVDGVIHISTVINKKKEKEKKKQKKKKKEKLLLLILSTFSRTTQGSPTCAAQRRDAHRRDIS